MKLQFEVRLIREPEPEPSPLPAIAGIADYASEVRLRCAERIEKRKAAKR